MVRVRVRVRAGVRIRAGAGAGAGARARSRARARARVKPKPGVGQHRGFLASQGTRMDENGCEDSSMLEAFLRKIRSAASK